jgi:hypothetical protein
LEPRSPETEQHTLGYMVIDFAENILHVGLFPWQKWLLVHMLELGDDGNFRFRKVVVLVARQNGKSTLSKVLALWFIIVWGWPLVLGTAQDLETAEEIWEGAVSLVEEDRELRKMLRGVRRVNGQKSLVLKSGKRYKVKAANRRAGRGFSGNLIMLDELREHQSWEAWAAITKTTNAQGSEAMVLALSNAGDLTSVVLRYLRKMAHAAIGDPDGINKDLLTEGPTVAELQDVAEEDGEEFDEEDLEEYEQDPDTLALFEWSAPPGCSKWDRQAWAQANPSLGWNPNHTQSILASDCEIDPEPIFRTEDLCQWSEGTLDGPFPPGSWEKSRNTPETGPDGRQVVRQEDRIVGPVKAGIHQSIDRKRVYVAFAGHRADGVAQVEVVAERLGSDWVRDWLMNEKRRDRITAVTGQTNGSPVSPLMKDLDEDDTFTIPVVKWSGGDLTAGWAKVYDDVRDNKVRHNPQPILDVAAATAVVKIFSGGASIPDDRASPADVAPLMAFTAAYWLLSEREIAPPPPPPPPAAVRTASVASSDDVATMGF